MAARGHRPYEGRPMQALGHHAPFPGRDPHHPLEPLHLPEVLENKVALQAAEIERLIRENQKLAATHMAMREEVGANQQEIQKIKSHIGGVRTEIDIQIRGLVEKIRKMDEDILAGETMEKELQQAHQEARSLFAKRQELTAEIQLLTEELQKVGGNSKRLPELTAELDELREEHQTLRVAFEREKGSNMEKVEKMRAMERDMISLARDIEKMRADIAIAEKGERAMNPYSGIYGGGYLKSEFGAGYNQDYRQRLSQMPGDAPSGNAMGFPDAYVRHPSQNSSGTVAVSPAGYSDAYWRPQGPGANTGVAEGRMGVSPTNAAVGGSIP